MSATRLYLDENIARAIGEILANRKCDILRPGPARMLGRSDMDQLLFAAENDRCLVSHDIADFVTLHSQFIQQGREHAGILLIAHDPRPSVIAAKILRRLAKENHKSTHTKLMFG
jgi:hypothetical protein